jgi:hypothetical protein
MFPPRFAMSSRRGILLSAELGKSLSRLTVITALEQLAAEGYLQTHRGPELGTPG